MGSTASWFWFSSDSGSFSFLSFFFDLAGFPAFGSDSPSAAGFFDLDFFEAWWREFSGRDDEPARAQFPIRIEGRDGEEAHANSRVGSLDSTPRGRTRMGIGPFCLELPQAPRGVSCSPPRSLYLGSCRSCELDQAAPDGRHPGVGRRGTQARRTAPSRVSGECHGYVSLSQTEGQKWRYVHLSTESVGCALSSSKFTVPHRNAASIRRGGGCKWRSSASQYRSSRSRRSRARYASCKPYPHWSHMGPEIPPGQPADD